MTQHHEAWLDDTIMLARDTYTETRCQKKFKFCFFVNKKILKRGGVPTANPTLANRLTIVAMGDLCSLIWCAVVDLLRSRVALQAEILVLRHQLNVLRRKSPKGMALGNIDRVVLVGLYRLAPKVLEALKIITPETVIRWHSLFTPSGAVQISLFLQNNSLLCCAGNFASSF
jgi:hypothetical protein